MALIESDDADLLTRILEQTKETEHREARVSGTVTERQQPTRTWTLPGIAGPTRVTTSFGHVPAHLVRVGDTLRTREGSYLRVLRISEFKFDDEFLERSPEAEPVVLRRNSLGPHMPLQDVVLSPAQEVSIGKNRYEERAIPASQITQARSSVDGALGMLVYFQFHLAKPAQIHCDGIWVTAATG